MKTYLDRYTTYCHQVLHTETDNNMKLHRKQSTYNNCNLDNIYNSCEAVRASLLYGKRNISNEEINFPLAFAIKIHRNGNQAFRLLRLIYRKHNIYCIHVDKKSAASIYVQFKTVSTCMQNIIVIDERVNVVYSSFRQIQAEFKCTDAVRKSETKWKYYINLTGQEFMLKTNMEIVKVLQLLNGTNDIESYKADGFEYRYKSKTVIVNNRLKKTHMAKEQFPVKIQLRKGSAYGMMSRDFIEFVRTDNFTQKFVSWLQDTYAPEETIWATLNALPHAPGGYAREITHKDSTFLSRAMVWKMEPTVCHGKYIHWVCIFGEKDLLWLIKQKEMVANKFYEDYGGLVLDCLEKHLYDRTMFPNLYECLNLLTYNDIPHLNREEIKS